MTVAITINMQNKPSIPENETEKHANKKMREKMKKIQVMLGEMWSNNTTNTPTRQYHMMMMMKKDKVSSTNKSNNQAGKKGE